MQESRLLHIVRARVAEMAAEPRRVTTQKHDRVCGERGGGGVCERVSHLGPSATLDVETQRRGEGGQRRGDSERKEGPRGAHGGRHGERRR